jgi:hypothetical protein
MKKKLVAREAILGMIVIIRGQRVILDADIADLYGVETKVLVQAVKRNKTRFPRDFMLHLNRKEFSILRSQIVTSSSWGGRRSLPYGFTEHGVAMLASVLRSRRATAVNIEIVRAFVELRRIITDNNDLARRIDDLERRYDTNFKAVFDAIRRLLEPLPEPSMPRKRIGYLLTGSVTRA